MCERVSIAINEDVLKRMDEWADGALHNRSNAISVFAQIGEELFAEQHPEAVKKFMKLGGKS